MKLLTIKHREEDSHLGIVLEEGILDVNIALLQYPEPGIAADMASVIAGGAQAASALHAYAERLLRSGGDLSGLLIREEPPILGPCVPNPGKIICIGLNYRRHAEESNAPIPNYPILFNKYDNALAGHGEPVPLPVPVSEQVDYEAELAIVIGKQAKNVAREEALSYVFGYCAANDLSARDLQFRTTQWLTGKSCDKFCPLGPWLVTADEVGDPNGLVVSCYVNGERRQHSNTADMIFSCEEIISYVSSLMTLNPGDVILTGTPEGVALGMPEDQRSYLKQGDTVTVEIEKLGRLTNRMIL